MRTPLAASTARNVAASDLSCALRASAGYFRASLRRNGVKAREFEPWLRTFDLAPRMPAARCASRPARRDSISPSAPWLQAAPSSPLCRASTVWPGPGGRRPQAVACRGVLLRTSIPGEPAPCSLQPGVQGSHGLLWAKPAACEGLGRRCLSQHLLCRCPPVLSAPTSLSQVLTFDGKPLIDMFSLADVPGIAGAAEATISVAGTVDEARIAASAEAKAADAGASAGMDEAAAEGDDDDFAEA